MTEQLDFTQSSVFQRSYRKPRKNWASLERERRSQLKSVPLWIQSWGLSFGLRKGVVVIDQNSQPQRDTARPQAFSKSMVHVVYQLDRIPNPRANVLQGMDGVREFLQWAEVRGHALKVGGTIPRVGDLDCIQRRKWVVLPGDRRGVCLLDHTPPLPGCPRHDGLCPPTVHHNSPAFLKVLPARHDGTTGRKELIHYNRTSSQPLETGTVWHPLQ